MDNANIFNTKNDLANNMFIHNSKDPLLSGGNERESITSA